MNGVTLAKARLELKTQISDADAVLTEALRYIAARLELEKDYGFAPRRELHRLDALGDGIEDDTGRLWLDAPLLEVVSLIDAAGQTLTTDDYRLETNPTTPVWSILRLPYLHSWSWGALDWRGVIQLTGLWGYRRHYSEAWLNSGDAVKDNPLTAGATTLTVNDADGVDAQGFSPRFSPLQILRIGTELLEVQPGINLTTNTVPVLRGVLGSTAASHIQNTAIETWLPEPALAREVARWASYLYARRGSFEQTSYDGIATVSFPPDIPASVQNVLDDFPRVGLFGGV